MKFIAGLALFAASTEAFTTVAPRVSTTSSALAMAEIGDTGIAFENVAREWRCKYTVRMLSIASTLLLRLLFRITLSPSLLSHLSNSQVHLVVQVILKVSRHVKTCCLNIYPN